MAASSQERVAAITGGAGGIGEACVARLRRDGWKVVVLDRNMDLAREVAARHGAVAREIDLADVASIDEAARWVERQVGPCSALAAVAAHLENPHMPEMQDDAEWDAILRVNLTGTFRTLTAFGAGMLERRDGAIVTVGSINSYCGLSNLTVYSMSKGALMTMTRNLANTLGPEHIRANQLNVGWTWTANEDATQQREGRKPGWQNHLPLRDAPTGRIMQPEEIAAHTAFWLSEDSAPVSGQIYEAEQFPVIGRG